MKVSWAMSSTRSVSRTMRPIRRSMRRWYLMTSSSKAFWSPATVRSTSIRSVSPGDGAAARREASWSWFGRRRLAGMRRAALLAREYTARRSVVPALGRRPRSSQSQRAGPPAGASAAACSDCRSSAIPAGAGALAAAPVPAPALAVPAQLARRASAASAARRPRRPARPRPACQRTGASRRWPPPGSDSADAPRHSQQPAAQAPASAGETRNAPPDSSPMGRCMHESATRCGIRRA